MNIDLMKRMLDRNLGEKVATDALKMLAINNSQMKIASLLLPGLLTELQYIKTGVTLTSGKTAALTSAVLDYNILGGEAGIMLVKVNGVVAVKLDENTQQMIDNGLYSGSVAAADYYWRIHQNKIEVWPKTAVLPLLPPTACDVWFIRQPAVIAELVGSVPDFRIQDTYGSGSGTWQDTTGAGDGTIQDTPN